MSTSPLQLCHSALSSQPWTRRQWVPSVSKSVLNKKDLLIVNIFFLPHVSNCFFPPVNKSLISLGMINQKDPPTGQETPFIQNI